MEIIFKFIIGIQDDDVDLSREGRVPRFWADDRSGGFFVADFIVLLVGVCFEAIHYIAWAFGIPFGSVLVKDDGLWEISPNCYFFGALSGGIPYILVWMVILVLAFTSLKDLPPGAYETVHWTTFIPHI